MKIFFKHFPLNREYFSKLLLTKSNLVLIAILILAAVVRFYNFPNRVTFWTEQARSLVVSANYIKEKPSLLGQEYFRQDSNAHIIYSGALFNYSLVPLLLTANYDPINISLYFAFLNLVTGLVIYFVAKRIFGYGVALLSLLLFMFNADMIYHSLFIWNYNYLPLVGILLFYFCWRYLKLNKPKYIFLTGLVSGIGISLQYLFAPIALITFGICMFWKKRKLSDLFIFVIGLSIANLPLIIFDLRHEFFQTKTLFQYFIDTLGGGSDASIAYYYFLPFWPLFALGGGILTFKIWKQSKVLAIFVVMLYLFLNLSSKSLNLNEPTGMPTGINVNDISSSSKTIADDVSGDFNVAEVLDFDKRAYVLRYYVEFVYGKKPLNDTDYQSLSRLYVLSQKGYNFESSGVWEISSGGKYIINLLTDVGQGYGIYKLTKN